MISINKCILYLALTLTTATALSHGHIARSSSHHEVARNVVDDLTKKDAVGPQAVVRRRASNSQRCKARPKADTKTSTTTSAHHKSTPAKADVAPPHKESTTHTSSKKSDAPKPTPKSTPHSDGASFSGGLATFYTQNGTPGACGAVHPDSALICALYTPVYSGGQHCGKQIQITNVKNGKTLSVTVADECPTCQGNGYVDLSEAAFKALGGTQDEGVFPITYHF